MLVGGRLQAKPHFLPHLKKRGLVVKVLNIIYRITDQQTESGHVPWMSSGTKFFDLIREVLAIHDESIGSIGSGYRAP